MPKIIEHLEERLVEEARRQAETGGYTAMTIRSVAKNCSVGVGTVYNYFPSKDALTAAFLLRDWKECIRAIHQVGQQAQSCDEVLLELWTQLRGFLERYQKIFGDAGAAAVFSKSVGTYHGLLRSQLAEPLRRFCPDTFTAEFAAEAMLTWTINGRSYEDLLPLMKKLM